MRSIKHRRMPLLMGLLAAMTVSVVAGSSGRAQAPPRLREGFDVVVPAAPAGEEITTQSNLWMLEVALKPMRMRWVDVTNPATGETTRELIWYQVYKAVHRPLPRKQDSSDTKPVNDEDVPPPPMFVPEFTLVTVDEGGEKVYQDVILPEAQAAINRRERRVYKNPVEIISELPPPTPEGEEAENPLYGVAIWKAVDPDTDYFTVYMTGFSNGYQLGKTPQGETLAQRKTIMQEYWRPGDRFEATEIEIRRRGAPRWIYRADENPITVLGSVPTQPAATP